MDSGGSWGRRLVSRYEDMRCMYYYYYVSTGHKGHVTDRENEAEEKPLIAAKSLSSSESGW